MANQNHPNQFHLLIALVNRSRPETKWKVLRMGLPNTPDGNFFKATILRRCLIIKGEDFWGYVSPLDARRRRLTLLNIMKKKWYSCVLYSNNTVAYIRKAKGARTPFQSESKIYAIDTVWGFCQVKFNEKETRPSRSRKSFKRAAGRHNFCIQSPPSI